MWCEGEKNGASFCFREGKNQRVLAAAGAKPDGNLVNL